MLMLETHVEPGFTSAKKHLCGGSDFMVGYIMDLKRFHRSGRTPVAARV